MNNKKHRGEKLNISLKDIESDIEQGENASTWDEEMCLYLKAIAKTQLLILHQIKGINK